MLQGHDTCKYVFTDITFGVPGDHHMLVICVAYQRPKRKSQVHLVLCRSPAPSISARTRRISEERNLGGEGSNSAHIFS